MLWWVRGRLGKEAVLLAGFLKVVSLGLAMEAQGDLVFHFS
jgi:hypothetical protein